MGRGWVGTKDPPPYFGVEKLKKRGIRVIRDSGRAQFQDLGSDFCLFLCSTAHALWYRIPLPLPPLCVGFFLRAALPQDHGRVLVLRGQGRVSVPLVSVLQKFAPLPFLLWTLGQLFTLMEPARMRSWHANSLGTIVLSATKRGSGSVTRGTKRSTPTKSMVCGPMFGGSSTYVGVSGNTAWNGTYANLSGGTIRRAAYSLRCAPSLKSVASWSPQRGAAPSIMAPAGGHQHPTPNRPPKGHFRQPQHPRQSADYDCQVGPQIWT